MGRTLQPRESYVRDAQTLQRIIQALNVDESRSAEWRREQIERLSAVISAFNADATRVPKSKASR